MRWKAATAALVATGLTFDTPAHAEGGLIQRLEQLEDIGLDWVKAEVNTDRWAARATGDAEADASYRHFRYARTRDGLVRLDGWMRGCPKSAEDKAPVFRLAKGFRPGWNQYFTIASARLFTTKDDKTEVFYQSAQVHIRRDGALRIIENHNPTIASRLKSGEMTENCAADDSRASWYALSGVVFPVGDTAGDDP